MVSKEVLAVTTINYIDYIEKKINSVCNSTVDLKIYRMVIYMHAVNTFTSVMVANCQFLISFIPLAKFGKLWINENDSIM